jgi:hypothetical protein
VGNDTRISFWYDLWCGGTLLKETFLELFQIAQNKICNSGRVYELVEWSLIGSFESLVCSYAMFGSS